jgi:DNA-binding LacI/PurR family transcriptional regulator
VNNLVFFGAAKVANQFEVGRERNLMMAAFDIGEYANLLKRPLLSADQNMDELAGAAVRLLLSPGGDDGSRENHIAIPIPISKYRLSRNHNSPVI